MRLLDATQVLGRLNLPKCAAPPRTSIVGSQGPGSLGSTSAPAWETVSTRGLATIGARVVAFELYWIVVPVGLLSNVLCCVACE
jgi:hypothetical protein